MWVYDLKTLRFVEVNEFACEHYGYTREEFLAMTIMAIRPEGDRERLKADLRSLPAAISHSEGWQHRKRDGSIIDVSITSHSLEFGDRLCRLVLATDVSDRRRSERLVAHMARHDALTNLPNRAALEERLAHTCERPASDGMQSAVAFIDIDRFKRINDTYGHRVGDDILIAVATRLGKIVRSGDMLARPGGDEFIVVIEQFANQSELIERANQILIALEKPFEIDGLEHHVTASVGVSVIDHDDRDPQVLIQHADMAIYQAKSEGGNRIHLFAPQLQREATRRMRVELALRESLTSGGFSLNYQPVIEVSSGDIIAAEALLRWTRAAEFTSTTAEYIRIAEESRLIVPLGAWILEDAIRAAGAWHRAGRRISVNVNVSPLQFDDPGFVGLVEKTCRMNGLDPTFLTLEITENALVDLSPRTTLGLNRLRTFGVRLAVDDFGTGYSSLHYLKRLPIDIIKIDRSFVTDIASNLHDAAIVEAVVTMGSKVGMTIVAEGVETASDRDKLAAIGCGYWQGYFSTQPLTEPAFTALYDRHRNSLA